MFTWCRNSVDHSCISTVTKPCSVFSSPHQSPQPKYPQMFPQTPALNPQSFLFTPSLKFHKPSLSLQLQIIKPSLSQHPQIPQVFHLTLAPNPIKLSISFHPQFPTIFLPHPSLKSLVTLPLIPATKPQRSDLSAPKPYYTILPPGHQSSIVQFNHSKSKTPWCYFTFQPAIQAQNPQQSKLLPKPQIPTILLYHPFPKTHNHILFTPPHPIYPYNPAPLPHSQIPTIFLHHPKASKCMSTTQSQIPSILLH